MIFILTIQFFLQLSHTRCICFKKSKIQINHSVQCKSIRAYSGVLVFLCCCMQGAENQIHTAVGTVGPVSIAFDAIKSFLFYKKGVYSR